MLQLSLKQKLTVILIVLGVSTLGFSSVILNSERTLSDQTTQLINHEMRMLDIAHRLKLSVVQVQQWLTDISATRGRDGLDDGFAEADKHAKEFRQLVAELQEIDPAHQADYQAMLPTFDDYYGVGKRMAQRYIDEGPEGGNQSMADFDAVAAAISEKIDAFLQNALTSTSRSSEQTTSTLDHLRWSTLSGTGLLILVLLGLGLLFRSIVNRLGMDPDLLSEIATQIANGNLQGDEKDRQNARGVYQALLAMRDKLRIQIEQDREHAREMSRTKTALDSASTSVMVIDHDHCVIYLNHSTERLFKQLETAIKTYSSDFSGSQLVGYRIDKLTTQAKQDLAQINAVEQFTLTFGEHTLQVVATPVVDEQGERLGTVLEWGDLTDALKHEAEQRERIQEERKIAATNARIRSALDNVSASVMLADVDRQIIYVNSKAKQLLGGRAEQLRQQIPHFDPNKMLGSSIDVFHSNPQHQAELIANLKQTHQAEVKIGSLVMKLVANPVISADGERLGTAVEWFDRTEEVAVEQEIDALVAAASNGDLSRRIELADKSGFFLQLGQNFNALMGELSDVFDEIAVVMSRLAEGDLGQPIQKNFKGTFESVKQDINTTIQNLSGVLSELHNTADTISHTAGEITHGNTSLSSRTEQQASGLEETAASMEQLTSTVRNNADNAQQADQLSSTARQSAEQGGQVVAQAMAAMHEINDSSNQIAEIISVIDGIAFQTNLLALNASVEAARAGEQGRGFAVVATEVRNLASRSAEAAKQIKELIQDSQTKVRAGTELVNASGKTLDEIVQGIKRVGDIVAEIAAASSEQAAGIDQVNQAVTSMDELTQQNAALAEQTSAASANMNEKASEMRQLVGFFKLAQTTATTVHPTDYNAEMP